MFEVENRKKKFVKENFLNEMDQLTHCQQSQVDDRISMRCENGRKPKANEDKVNMDFKRLMEGKAQVDTESKGEMDEKESMVGGW